MRRKGKKWKKNVIKVDQITWKAYIHIPGASGRAREEGRETLHLLKLNEVSSEIEKVIWIAP